MSRKLRRFGVSGIWAMLWFVLLDKRKATPLMDANGNVVMFLGRREAQEAVERYGRNWLPVLLVTEKKDFDQGASVGG